MKTTDNLQELFTVVDKDDKIIGYKSRYECHHDKKLIHRVTNIAIFNTKGEILLQKRSLSKDLYPGLFTLSASGHVSKGEAYKKAAQREMEEEIGIKDVPITFVARQLVKAAQETEMLVLYKGVYDGAFSFINKEVQHLKFYAKEQIASFKRFITPCAYASLKILKYL